MTEIIYLLISNFPFPFSLVPGNHHLILIETWLFWIQILSNCTVKYMQFIVHQLYLNIHGLIYTFKNNNCSQHFIMYYVPGTVVSILMH